MFIFYDKIFYCYNVRFSIAACGEGEMRAIDSPKKKESARVKTLNKLQINAINQSFLFSYRLSRSIQLRLTTITYRRKIIYGRFMSENGWLIKVQLPLVKSITINFVRPLSEAPNIQTTTRLSRWVKV